MQSVTFKSVLEGVSHRMGLDPDNLLSVEKASFAEFIESRVRQGWEYYPWPETMKVEQRQYRPDYSGSTTYSNAASDVDSSQVYWPQEDKYYQALKSTSGNAPTDSSGTVNAQWATLGETYAASDYATATDYAVGDSVFYPTDREYYTMHTNASAGTVPTNASYWGKLTPFIRFIKYEQTSETKLGEIFSVTSRNPEANRAPTSLNYTLIDDGLLPEFDSGSKVWVKFRPRTPRFTSTLYNNTTANYYVGDVVYDDGSAAGAQNTGECYECIVAHTNSPARTPDNTTYWTKQEIPKAISEYVKQAAYGSALLQDGQHEKAPLIEELSLNLLYAELDKVQNQQGQYRTIFTSPLQVKVS